MSVGGAKGEINRMGFKPASTRGRRAKSDVAFSPANQGLRLTPTKVQDTKFSSPVVSRTMRAEPRMLELPAGCVRCRCSVLLEELAMLWLVM